MDNIDNKKFDIEKKIERRNLLYETNLISKKSDNLYIEIKVVDNVGFKYYYEINDIIYEYTLSYLLNYSKCDFLYSNKYNKTILKIEILKDSYLYKYMKNNIKVLHRMINYQSFNSEGKRLMNLDYPVLANDENSKIIFKFINVLDDMI
jgi:hypothetical protein